MTRIVAASRKFGVDLVTGDEAGGRGGRRRPRRRRHRQCRAETTEPLTMSDGGLACRCRIDQLELAEVGRDGDER